MASKLIGRTSCPECGFGAAHVKQSEKTPYRYCPECGAQYFPRNDRQRADLAKKTRPLEAPPTAPAAPAPGPTPAAAPPTPAAPPAPTPTPAAPAAPQRRRSFADL